MLEMLVLAEFFITQTMKEILHFSVLDYEVSLSEESDSAYMK